MVDTDPGAMTGNGARMVTTASSSSRVQSSRAASSIRSIVVFWASTARGGVARPAKRLAEQPGEVRYG